MINFEKEFDEIERKIFDIDPKIELTKQAIFKKFDLLSQKLKSHSDESFYQIENILNQERNSLLSNLKSELDKLLDSLKCQPINSTKQMENKFTKFVCYKEQNIKISHLDVSFEKSDFYKKLKYLHFFSDYQEVNIKNLPTSYRDLKIIPLTRNQSIIYFEYSRLGILQLRSNNQLTCIKEIQRKYPLDKLLSNKQKLVGLFNGRNTFTELVVYDTKLNLLAFKYFADTFSLHSVNSKEIIVWSTRSKKCLVLDFCLNQVYSFGQEENKYDAFYLGETWPPIQLTDEYIVLYDRNILNLNLMADCKFNNLFLYSNEFGQNCSVKILTRNEGYLVKILKFDDTNENLVKFDENFNFLVLDEMNFLKYFDSNGNLMIKNNSIFLGKFKSLGFTLKNDLYYVDQKLKKVYFI